MRYRFEEALDRQDWETIQRLSVMLRRARDPGLRLKKLAWPAFGAAALAAPRAPLRRMLLAHLPPGMRAGLRLTGGFEPAQGIQNAGSLLTWRLSDAGGTCRLAAVEKVLPRPSAVRHLKGVRPAHADEWLREAYFYRGLRRAVAVPDCHVAPCLGLRRHDDSLGLVIADLRHEGWRPVEPSGVQALAPRLAAALAGFATGYRLAPPADSPRWHLPGHRPFFARPGLQRYENFARMLGLAGVSRGRSTAILDGLRALDTGWEMRVAASGLPRLLCHGDPHYRNLLTDAAGRVALVDMENYCFGPAGLDIGRFIGTSITRCTEALAGEIAAAPSQLPDRGAGWGAGWQTAGHLADFATLAERAHLARLHAAGIDADPRALERQSRIAAVMSLLYTAATWRRIAEQAPGLCQPMIATLSAWLALVRRHDRRQDRRHDRGHDRDRTPRQRSGDGPEAGANGGPDGGQTP